jgi:hypothetical protein
MIYSNDSHYCWLCNYLKDCRGEIGQIVRMCFDYVENNDIDEEERHKIINQLPKIAASEMPSIVVNNSGSIWTISNFKSIEILPHV